MSAYKMAARALRTAIWLACCACVGAPLIAAAAAPPVRIGILAFRPKQQTLEQWQPLAAALKRAVADREFVVEAYSYQELDAAVAARQLDFVLTNPGHYVLLAQRSGLSSPLATLALKEGEKSVTAFGGVIFTRADQNSIDTLGDLGGKRIAIVAKESLGGYQMQAYELHLAGLPLPQDSRLVVTGMPHDKTVEAVLAGQAEVGFVRTGVIEGMAREGKLEMKALKILNRQSYPEFPALASTHLYPEWPFVAMPHAEENLTRHVAAALFRLEEDTAATRALDIHGFGVPADYGPVEDLLRQLRLPPFEAMPAFTARDVWLRYRGEVLAAALASALILALGVALMWSNRALGTSEERLRLALAAARQGWFDLNLSTGRAAVSPEYALLLGYRPEEYAFTLQTWLDDMHPDDRAGVRASLDAALATGEATDVTYRRRRKAGDWIWLNSVGQVVKRDPTGKPLRMIGVHTDVTERKRAEAALQSSDMRFHTLARVAPVGIFHTDTDGLCLYVNERWCEITGMSQEAARAAGWSLALHPDDRDWVAAKWYRFAAADLPFREEYRFQRPDGSVVWVIGQASGLKGADGNVIGYVGTITDITINKNNESALTEAKAAAEAATLAKSRFLATMSHEIRTPMNGILGMAQMLLMPDLSDEERRDFARTVLNSGHTLLTLLNDILDLSKVEAGKLELEAIVFEPERVIHEAKTLFAEAAKAKRLRLEAVSFVPSGQRYLGDPNRLRQMLCNLVSNAVKFTAQGEVRISVRELRRDKQDAMLAFSVADSGIGIAKEKQRTLFEAFSQADNSTTRVFGGSGLGLSIVRSLATLMGGEAGVDSEFGQGSRFWFHIKTSIVAAGQDSRARERPHDYDAGPAALQAPLSGRVLVVEDDKTNRKVIEVVLVKLGLSVALAEQGQQAFDMIAAGESFDLVLMDVQMPILDGYAATEKIRNWEVAEGRPHLPIIALTADAFERDRQRSLAAGMDDFLTKPIAIDSVRTALLRWLPVTT